MHRNVMRALALALVLALIGCGALAATASGLASLAKKQGYTVTRKALGSGAKNALSYEENTKGTDRLLWSSDKQSYAIAASKADDKVGLKALYVQFARVYRWKAVSYSLDGALVLGYNVKGAQKVYKTLSACRKGVQAYARADSGSDKPAPAPQASRYKLNLKSKVFHLIPGCSPAQKMKAENTAYSDKSYDALVAAGYKPCGLCFR